MSQGLRRRLAESVAILLGEAAEVTESATQSHFRHADSSGRFCEEALACLHQAQPVQIPARRDIKEPAELFVERALGYTAVRGDRRDRKIFAEPSTHQVHSGLDCLRHGRFRRRIPG
jgi:hypothetical protein